MFEPPSHREPAHQKISRHATSEHGTAVSITWLIDLDELPTGLRYARDRVDGAIKVVITPQVVLGRPAGSSVAAFAEMEPLT